jgi:type II secretory pathway component PulF
MTSLTQPIPPPAPGSLLRHAGLSIGVACVLSVAGFFLATTSTHRASLWLELTQLKAWGFLIANLLAAVGLLLYLLCLAANAFFRPLIHPRPFQPTSQPRLTVGAAQWLTALILGAGTLALLWGAYHTLNTLLSMSPARLDYFVGFFAELFSVVSFLIFAVFVGPSLWLLLSWHTESNRLLDKRLLFVRAASLAAVGLDPTRALADALPPIQASSRRHKAFAKAIGEGIAFSKALAIALPDMNPRDKALLTAGEELGILGPVLMQKSQEIQQEDQAQSRLLILMAFALEWSVILMLCLGISIFIFPAYRVIFREFGSSLPPATRLTDDTFQWFLGTLPNQDIPGALYILVPIFLFAVLIHYLTHAKHPFAAWAVKANIPWVRDALLKPGLMDVCLFLAHALRAGVSLPQAVHAASALEMNPALRSSMRDWESAMRQGQDPAQASISAGLPPLMTAFIRSSNQGPGLAQAIDHLGRYYQNQASRTRLALETLLPPLFTLLGGAAIGVVIVGLFCGSLTYVYW